jgi:prepilin-type N-terminal cleavage/methylation domain-containing protein
MYRKQSGFTLVEIAIVLVIIGLLLGGILKGQELIQNARVRNVADQQNAIKAAYYAFQDRYRALPGDYRDAAANIPNVVAHVATTNGNAQIEATESVYAWYHLTNAGFISCSECSADPLNAPTPNAGNSPVNAFGGVMSIVFDSLYNDGVLGTGTNANNLKSGNQIPANVLAEVDRKIDDGNPRTGAFRFSSFTAGGTAPTAAKCAALGTDSWIVVAPGPDANCGAANLF